MFSLVRPECLYERPIPERHRIVFYIGHVDAFDWNLVTGHAVPLPGFAPELDRLFAFGIDPEVGAARTDGPEDWPELEHVYEYSNRVRNEIDCVWEQVPEQLRHVALEHRLMHAETLAYMLHAMSPEMLIRPAMGEPVLERESRSRSEVVPVGSGQAVLGRDPTEGFGWDNEFGRHTINVPAFGIDRYKVTNGEYLEFVRAGGTRPHFWRERGGNWHLRRMFDEVALPPDWPVYVTLDQAQAYAQWRGAQLPSEAQWHRAAFGDSDAPYPWGVREPSPDLGNFDSVLWDPVPVTAHPQSRAWSGAEQLSGNGWEWTCSPFRPFPGFERFSFYPGYSADFFDDNHFVLKGASPRTDAVFLRRSFRNWFRHDYPYVFATFRCVHNLA
ncbi:MAG TPA: SUMF1/EgtB/PvdO family nonheme iron enzyme [Bryobacteraceae bacterium]|nr:SUMF1/EgtB/PvdO family nonheme iron enzyme [Bryobacteraceae bacterium]